MQDHRHNRALYFVALLTAAATFPLIFMGGLVTSHGAGLSVPDWPNSYGYNMFLFPPRLWIGNIFYEHTHRLMGTVLGMLSIALVIVAWRERRTWVSWLTIALLVAVCIQGLLGGLRVTQLNVNLAIVHACFAQAVFCLAALVVIATSRWWLDAPDLNNEKSAYRLIALAVACGFAIYLQLIAGALMRHNDAGLAIPDLPLAYGKILPPTTTTEIDAINAHRIWHLNLPRVTLSQIWMHFSHRIGAIIVSLTILALVGRIFFKHRNQRGLVMPAFVLLTLLAAQIVLGVCTVIYRKPADVASAHVAVGSLILVTTFLIIVRSMRLYARRNVVSHASNTLPAGLEMAH